MAAAVGSRAPDFTARNQHGEQVRLSDYAGRDVVLVFYPYAFSQVCTSELAALRDRPDLLAAAEFLAISCDPMYSLRAFADREDLQFPLLSDFNKQAIRDYGVFNEDMIGLRGIAKRAVFVLDKDGIVRHREVLDDARNEPDYGKALMAAQSTRGRGLPVPPRSRPGCGPQGSG